MSPVGPPTNTSSKIFPEGTRNAQHSVLLDSLHLFLSSFINMDTSIPSGGKTASLHQELTHSLNSPGHLHSFTHRTFSKRSCAAKSLCLTHSLAQNPHGPWKPMPAPVPAHVPVPTPWSTLFELAHGFPPPPHTLFPSQITGFYMVSI